MAGPGKCAMAIRRYLGCRYPREISGRGLSVKMTVPHNLLEKNPNSRHTWPVYEEVKRALFLYSSVIK